MKAVFFERTKFRIHLDSPSSSIHLRTAVVAAYNCCYEAEKCTTLDILKLFNKCFPGTGSSILERSMRHVQKFSGI